MIFWDFSLNLILFIHPITHCFLFAKINNKKKHMLDHEVAEKKKINRC